jgi:MFS family permease
MSTVKREKPSTFRLSLPLLITQFVNQAGDIGLSLLPMLLVARSIDAESSSLVMTLVKLCIAAGTFLGGWASDRIGLRTALICSLLLAAVGMGALPFSTTVLTIALTACVAQLGQGMFQSPARMLLAEIVPKEQRPEALAWLRVANNAGSVIVFFLGSIISGASFVFLMLFDCVTSLFAAAAGRELLPRSEKSPPHVLNGLSTGVTAEKKISGRSTWPPFLICAVALAGYSFLYNFFYVTLAARMQLQLGNEGVRLFARLMLLGTVMCTLFSVSAARRITSLRGGLLSGVGFVSVGSALALGEPTSNLCLYAGIGILTLGEITFNAVAQAALIELTPASAAPGRAYAVGLVIQSLGRVVGAALAFPLAVYGTHALTTVAVGTIVTLGLCWKTKT